MPKNTNKAKNSGTNFDLTTDSLLKNTNLLHYFNKIYNSYFSAYCQNYTQTTKLKPNQTGHNQI